MKKFILEFFALLLPFIVVFAFSRDLNVPSTIQSNLTIEEYYHQSIAHCISSLESIKPMDSNSKKKEAFLIARMLFKFTEPIMSYYNPEEYDQLNQANIVGVEEEGNGKFTLEIPFGFQVLEEQLYADETNENEFQMNLNQSIELLKTIQENKPIQINKTELLELSRMQIIRIATLGITGFDSPQKNSLVEAAYNYESIQALFNYFETNFTDNNLKNEWQAELKKMLQLKNEKFENFDRYSFIKNHTHYQLKLIQKIALDWGVSFPESMALNTSAENLFTASTFRKDFFSPSKHPYTEERSKLGEKLFNDQSFSSGGELSCASCHNKDKAFTDGLVHFEKQKRNTPTLLYSALQNEYFYDLRSKNLQDQILQVVEHKDEFHTELKIITNKILSNPAYAGSFEAVYELKATDDLVVDALSQYVKSLSPFNSKFDRNMREEEETLSASEKNGFNLFMGKAECGTCHFAPVFNGTVPPYFTITEMELIGVPNDSTNAAIDQDFGRYDVHQTENRKHFFKTPTVRNISKTAPYMHNGAYSTLFDLIEFYDDGGGAGLGFDLPFQTLPSDSLHLTKTEIDDLIAFMNSLEDQPIVRNNSDSKLK